ncbi:MAG TPA: HAMP domain-containing sensor histidine kinase [Jatrophihabitantaceae bacterium]|nr:HAMP domain-containing sensor histidine kinase [Jatrophihabitantaceae bacterium]
MRFTPRRRIILALVAISPIAYYALSFIGFTILNLGRHYKSGYVICDDTWRSDFNECAPNSFSPVLAWFEVMAVTAVFIAIGYGLARWALMPLREMADAVERFGPTSIGLRLHPDGPRDETKRLAEAVDGMLDRLAAGYESQRRFASNASHELRTPLATQRALIEVSLGSALSPDQIELLSRQLLATNKRNEDLVDGLLTLAETERGLVNPAPVRLDAVGSDAVATYQQTADSAGVTLTAELTPTTVVGEPVLLERLAGNLVQNAIKYNQPGGTASLRVSGDGSLVVTNSGPVIPQEHVAALFEPFRRVAGERLDHGAGVGLGLTIARSIVAAHGGAIDARANPGGGLTVAVHLRPAPTH